MWLFSWHLRKQAMWSGFLAFYFSLFVLHVNNTYCLWFWGCDLHKRQNLQWRCLNVHFQKAVYLMESIIEGAYARIHQAPPSLPHNHLTHLNTNHPHLLLISTALMSCIKATPHIQSASGLIVGQRTAYLIILPLISPGVTPSCS